MQKKFVYLTIGYKPKRKDSNPTAVKNIPSATARSELLVFDLFLRYFYCKGAIKDAWLKYKNQRVLTYTSHIVSSIFSPRYSWREWKEAAHATYTTNILFRKFLWLPAFSNKCYNNERFNKHICLHIFKQFSSYAWINWYRPSYVKLMLLVVFCCLYIRNQNKY